MEQQEPINKYDPVVMQKGIDKRKGQFERVKLFVEAHPDYVIQVNVCVPGVSEPLNCAVTLSGASAKEVFPYITQALGKQIAHLERKLMNKQ